MKIYLGRHGTASNTPPEPTLTADGKLETTHIATLLKKNHTPITTIYHSEKARAVQTATIYAQHLNLSPLPLPALNPSAPLDPLLDLLEDGALYVGHLPNIEELTSRLLLDSNTPLLNFIPSTLVCLNMQHSQWQIEWMINPQLVNC